MLQKQGPISLLVAKLNMKKEGREIRKKGGERERERGRMNW